jgi:aspartate/methionine/tyrosine aminotransferase
MNMPSRIDLIQPFHVMRLMSKARELEAQGKDIVHMEVGEPDFLTPAPIAAAGMEAIKQGLTHYTPALGLPQLREAISGYYQSRYRLDISPRRIVITPGASGGLQLLIALLVGPGSEVLMADPGYPCNRNIIRLYGGIPISLPLAKTKDFQLNGELIRTKWNSERTRGVIITTPSNPTGSVLDRQSLADIQSVVAAKGGFLIVDEIYQGLVYDVPDMTALEFGSDLYIVNSFSKYFGMTGWRVGWLVVPESAVPSVDKLAQNLFIAAATASQYAALAAFSEDTQDILEQRKKAFCKRRDFLLPALEMLGFKFLCKPEGAFYLYGDCSALARDSAVLAEELLTDAGVAVTPGIDFSTNTPSKYLRFTYTTGYERLAMGVDRIKRHCI